MLTKIKHNFSSQWRQDDRQRGKKNCGCMASYDRLADLDVSQACAYRSLRRRRRGDTGFGALAGTVQVTVFALQGSQGVLGLVLTQLVMVIERLYTVGR